MIPVINSIEYIRQWMQHRYGSYTYQHVLQAVSAALNIPASVILANRRGPGLDVSEARRAFVWVAIHLVDQSHAHCAIFLQKDRSSIYTSHKSASGYLSVNDALTIANIEAVYSELLKQGL